jgi:hypothetical protein
MIHIPISRVFQPPNDLVGLLVAPLSTHLALLGSSIYQNTLTVSCTASTYFFIEVRSCTPGPKKKDPKTKEGEFG